MERLPRTKCSVCEKIFCCPDHRRKHETSSHNLTRRKTMQVKTESYALEMRKSFLYLENHEPNLKEQNRKRKFSNVTAKSAVQWTSSKIEIANRKTIIAKRKKKFYGISDDWKSDDPSKVTEVVSPYQPCPDMNQLIADLISPVESDERVVIGKVEKITSESLYLRETTVFTTSTPMHKRVRTHQTDSEQPTTLPSSSKSVGHGRRRRVRFSSSGESLYTTACEDDSTSRGGLFSTVAGVLQAAITSLPGHHHLTGSEDVKVRETDSKCLRQSPICARRPLHPAITYYHYS